MPFTLLKIKGKTFKLVYSFNALAKAEALTGLNMFHGLNLQALTALQLRAMLWSTLQAAHPKMTLEEAGGLISNPVECNLVLDAVAEAWLRSMPEKEEGSPN